jgi:hypothetical protein
MLLLVERGECEARGDVLGMRDHADLELAARVDRPALRDQHVHVEWRRRTHAAARERRDQRSSTSDHERI